MSTVSYELIMSIFWVRFGNSYSSFFLSFISVACLHSLHLPFEEVKKRNPYGGGYICFREYLLLKRNVLELTVSEEQVTLLCIGRNRHEKSNKIKAKIHIGY